MAQINFNDLQTAAQSADNSNRIAFFTLKNDCDEAIVRFMHDSVDSFDILTTHPIILNGKYRRANCIRDPYDSVDKCPLCANNTKIEQKIYIHLVEYVRSATDGSIVAVPKVWERSISYANTLKSYLDNYGMLSNMVCKIIRHGAPGDMTTNYEIIPNLSKDVFPDTVYVKHPEFFADYKALGTIVLDKTEAELQEFLVTGNFPMVQNTAAAAPAVQNTFTSNLAQNYVSRPAPAPAAFAAQNQAFVQPQAPTFNSAPQPATTNFDSTMAQSVPQQQAPAFTGSENVIDRPIRYYN